MFIMFGWLKETVHEKPLLDTYCYHCNNNSTWDLFRVTEWVTLFEIKALPFLNKHYIVCDRCNDTFDLDKKISKQVGKLHQLNPHKSQRLHDELVSQLEKKQLQGKSQRQLDYIKSIRSVNKDD